MRCRCGRRMVATGSLPSGRTRWSCPICQPGDSPTRAEALPRDPYSPRRVHFLLVHFQELEQRGTLAREWAQLPRYGVCTCKSTRWQVAPRTEQLPARRRSRPAHAPLPVSVEELDLCRAYAALPRDWRAKTEVQLLMAGVTEDQIAAMQVCLPCFQQGRRHCAHSPFAAAHRARQAEEAEVPPPPPDRLVRWNRSIWQSLSDYLNGIHPDPDGEP